MSEKRETIIIKKGDMINRGLHEDDDYLVARVNLVGEIIKYCPGAIQVIIPQLTREMNSGSSVKLEDEIFFIHQPAYVFFK